MKDHNNHPYKDCNWPEFLIPLYNVIYWRIAMWKAKKFWGAIKEEGDLT